MKMRRGIEYTKRPVVHYDDPECRCCGAMDEMHEVMNHHKAVHRSQENSLAFFQNENTTFCFERSIQIGVVANLQEIAKKCIKLRRMKEPTMKFRTNQAMT